MGQFWAGKMRKTQIAIAESTKVLENVSKANITMETLRSQWSKQFLAVTSHAPGTDSLFSSYIINYSYLLAEASTRGANRLTHALIALMEAEYIVQQEIRAKRAQITSFDPANNLSDLVGSSITLQDLEKDQSRLQGKIAQHLTSLKAATGEGETSIRLLIQDEFQSKIFKCQALLMRLCSKVRQALLAAVPFKRRISRAKKGRK